MLSPLPGPVVATADEDGILPACVRESAGVNGMAGDVMKGGATPVRARKAAGSGGLSG